MDEMVFCNIALLMTLRKVDREGEKGSSSRGYHGWVAIVEEEEVGVGDKKCINSRFIRIALFASFSEGTDDVPSPRSQVGNLSLDDL